MSKSNVSDKPTELEQCPNCLRSFKSVGKHRRFCKGIVDNEQSEEVHEPIESLATQPTITNSEHLLLQADPDDAEDNRVKTEETMTWSHGGDNAILGTEDLVEQPPSRWQRFLARIRGGK